MLTCNLLRCHMPTHTIIWRPSPNYRVAGTPPLVHIAWMLAWLVRFFSQVVIVLPLGLVPCMSQINKSNVMPHFLTRWPWKVSRLWRSPSRHVGFVLALLNTSSLVTCAVGIFGYVLHFCMNCSYAITSGRVSETEPKRCMFETSCYAFGGRIRHYAKVNLN